MKGSAMTESTVGGSATAAKACRDAGIYDEAIREIESRVEMLEHRIGRVKDDYARLHRDDEHGVISSGLVWAADEAAGLAEFVDGVRRRVATSLAPERDRRADAGDDEALEAQYEADLALAKQDADTAAAHIRDFPPRALCLASAAADALAGGYGECIQAPGHDGAHRDANGYEFTTAVQS